MEANLQRLEEVSAGLFYLSESDYPFNVVSFEASANLEETLLALVGNGEKVPVRVVELE
jgi:hypothetical protein